MRPELSAGGVVVRRMRGRHFLAVVKVQRGELVVSLPKGHPEPGESAEQAALREVREETGLVADSVEKLGDVRYWYVRGGRRVLKIVSFFLCRYRSGSVRDHDYEVESAAWIPLEDAPRLLAYRGEREMAERAMSRLAGHL